MINQQKITWLNALRGVAILGVILVHTGQYGREVQGLGFYPTEIVRAGKMGVQLFFMLSAITLFLGYHRKRNLHISHFFLRRFLRIAPLYYLGIVYYLFQDGWGPRYWLGDMSGITWENIASNVFFVHAFSPYFINSLVPGGWSIGIEMLFYIICPFLFRYVTDINRALLFTALSVLPGRVLSSMLAGMHPIGSDRLWADYLYLYLPNQLHVFGIGIVLYFLLFPARVQLSRVGVISLLLISLSSWHHQTIFNVLCGFFVCLIALFRMEQDNRWLNNRVLYYLGEYSFALYIAHFAVLHWLNCYGLLDFLPVAGKWMALSNFLLRYLLVVLLSTVVAYGLHRWIEQPCIRLGKRLTERRERKLA